MNDPSIRLLVADDHALLRSGLRLVLDAEPGFTVVGEASDAPEAIRLLKLLTPDVALVDLAMPGGGGIATLQAIREAHLPTRALVITMFDTLAYLRAALDAGAAGYVTKKVPGSELVRAIRAVAKGGTWIDVAVSAEEVGKNPQRTGPTPPSPQDVLSGREQEVLGFLAHGHTNREIAEKLGVSVKTIEGYRARLMEKLGIKSRAELVRYAMDVGVLGQTPG
jgi:two-component system response regulator NreC